MLRWRILFCKIRNLEVKKKRFKNRRIPPEIQSAEDLYKVIPKDAIEKIKDALEIINKILECLSNAYPKFEMRFTIAKTGKQTENEIKDKEI